MHKHTIKQAANGNWPLIIRSLAEILIPAIERKGRHVPCPIHGGRDGFRLYKDFDESGGGICNTCGSFPDGFALLQWSNGYSFAESLLAVAQVLGLTPDRQIIPTQINHRHLTQTSQHPLQAYAIYQLQKAYATSTSIHNLKTDAPPIYRYFTNRGLYNTIANPPEALRFHPNMPYHDHGQKKPKYFPTLLAEVKSHAGDVIGLHRTYLTPTGDKAPVASPKKLMSAIMPGITNGSAIRLYPATDLLAVAEGIETALAVHTITDWPVWSCISAGGLSKLRLPESITTLHIMADKDRSKAGIHAAHYLAKRYQHLNVTIHLPQQHIPQKAKSLDWCDILAFYQGVGA